MMSKLKWFLLLGAVIAGVGAAVINVMGRSRLTSYKAEIDEQNAIKHEIKERFAEHDAMIKSWGQEIADAPDSLKAFRQGESIKRSRSIAKEQMLLEGKQERAERRIDELLEMRSDVRQGMKVWNQRLGSGGLVLLGLFFGVHWASRRSRARPG